MTYKTTNPWCSVDAHFQNRAASVSLSHFGWSTANMSFMIVCIPSPPRLPLLQEQKSLTRHSLSCSRWGRECFSVFWRYKGSWFIWTEQWRAKVNILRSAVGLLNATTNKNTWNTEMQIEINGSIQPHQNLWVVGCGCRVGLPRPSRSDCWTILELNHTVFAFQTQISGRLPRPVPNTRYGKEWLVCDYRWRKEMDSVAEKEFGTPLPNSDLGVSSIAAYCSWFNCWTYQRRYHTRSDKQL
jgi:hypothetical protein